MIEPERLNAKDLELHFSALVAQPCYSAGQAAILSGIRAHIAALDAELAAAKQIAVKDTVNGVALALALGREEQP